MPEIKTEIIDTNVKYNADDNDALASQITKNWDDWDKDRQRNIDIEDKLAALLAVEEEQVEYETTFVDDNGAEDKKTVNKIKDADILQLYTSAVAHTYNSTFKTPSQMIDIQLENIVDDVEMLADRQKAALLKVWKQARGKQEGRKAIENLYSKGEMVFYVNWQRIFQNVRRKNLVAKTINFLGQPFGIKMQEWQVQRQLKYDGALIKCLNSRQVVFDVTRVGQDGCPWIYQEYETYNNIADNEQYKKFLDAEALEEIQTGCDKDAPKQDNKDAEKETERQQAFKDNKAEVLTYFGDITIKKEGKSEFYRNLRIVIIARKYVAAFEYNPNIICPFVYCAKRVHKDTLRGVPELSFIIPMTEATEECLNRLNRAIGLSINQCRLVPEGAFSKYKGNLPIEEGKNYEYDPSVMLSPGAQIIPIDVTSGMPYHVQFLQLLEGKKEQAFGRYKYSTGNTGAEKRTAKEAAIIQAGQDATVAYELDIIGDCVVELFEKLGEYIANFQDQPEQIVYKDKTGAEQIGVVDDTVRQASYSYMIGDTQTSVDKKANAEQFLLALKQIAELAMAQGKRLSLKEIINTFGSIYDIANPMKFIEDMPMPPPMGGGGVNEPSGTAGMPTPMAVVPNAGMEGVAPALPEGNI